MNRQTRQTALFMEMNLLLGPLTLAVCAAAAMMSVLGFPKAIEFVAPTLSGDAAHAALMATIAPGVLALRESWALGLCTVRGEPYAFGFVFWMALLLSAVAVALALRFHGPLALYALGPVWLCAAHMAALQWRLRAPIKTNTRSAS